MTPEEAGAKVRAAAAMGDDEKPFDGWWQAYSIQHADKLDKNRDWAIAADAWEAGVRWAKANAPIREANSDGPD